MDATMQEAANDQGADFDAVATEKEVRDNCRTELDDRAKEVYLLARVDCKKLKIDTEEEDPDNEGEFIKRKVEVLFPDSKKLKEDIINSLDDLQKTALMFSVFHVSKRLIEMKAKELGARIKWIAAASALGGAVPVPGISAVVDLALVFTEVKFQKKQLQIDDGTMKKHAERFGPVFKEKLEAGASEAMKPFLVSDLALATLITARLAIPEALETAVKTVPILGSIAGATVSFGVTFYTLRTALNAHTEIAQKLINVVNELTVEEGMQKDE